MNTPISHRIGETFINNDNSFKGQFSSKKFKAREREAEGKSGPLPNIICLEELFQDLVGLEAYDSLVVNHKGWNCCDAQNMAS